MSCGICVNFKVFQSTRPRGARLGLLDVGAADGGVSIHAPARGATQHSSVSSRVHVVSIHAPARGATATPRLRSTATSCFNPRAREGRDYPRHPFMRKSFKFQSTRPRGARPWADAHPYAIVLVSIHAPARGATTHMPKTLTAFAFQSTRPRGARPSRSFWPICRRLFQSTRPRGARHVPLWSSAAGFRFQSTRPRGARPLTPTGPHSLTLFQSTRPRGARREQ